MPGFPLDATGKRLSFAAYAFLALLCVAFYVPGFTALPPTDRDESSFAQATKQMIETGNYVDIRLQAEPRYKKPIGIYWLQAASVRFLSAGHLDDIWAYRVPSFLGATIAVLLTAALGTLLFGPMAGFLAAIMLAGCVLLNTEARLAKTDAVLLPSVMAMQYALARAYIKRESGAAIFLLFWTAISIGVLVKGPIIFLILASTLLWLWQTEKNLAWLSALRPLLGVSYALLLAAPWFIAISMQSHGDFIAQSAGDDFIGKLLHGQNRGFVPPGFYLLAFPATFFPFSLFTLLGLPDSWANRREAAVRFCLGWIIPAWIVFELPPTKLLHYVLPLYPAIAMLAAKALLDGYPVLIGAAKRWFPAIVSGLWLIIGAGFAFGVAALPVIAGSAPSNMQIMAGLLLIASQGFGLFLLLKRQAMMSVIVLACGFLVFVATAFNDTLPNIPHVWLSRDIVAMARQVSWCPQPHVISSAYDEPSLVFLAGTDTLITNDAEAAAHEMENDKCSVAVVDDRHRDDFLSVFKGGKLPPIVGTIEGLDNGRGRKTELTLYVQPWNP